MELGARQQNSQNLKQEQRQKLSQQQILGMKMLSLSSTDLENEIYDFAEKNPALEIIERKEKFRERNKRNGDFEKFLDSQSDERKSLHEHLKFQLNSMKLSEEESELGEKLIDNLDSKGFHILSPYSFIENRADSKAVLEKLLSIIQSFDPIGVCVKNVEESLFVQAKENPDATELSLFILNGHLDFLNPPKIPKIQKKLRDFFEAESKLKTYGKTGSEKKLDSSENEIQKALDFIKTLDPNPSRNFGTEFAKHIFVSAIVKKTDGEIKVNFTDEELPEIKISSFVENYANSKINSEQEKVNITFARNSIQEAKNFIDSVAFRKTSIHQAVLEIVNNQFEFFEKGPQFLKPFLQKELARILKLNESTISRIANEKYLECDWGIFPLSYFFSNAVYSAVDSQETENANSKESVKFQIEKILEEHKNDKKTLSDQKISDFLAQKGIKIARRTVAKYRSELQLGSSYER